MKLLNVYVPIKNGLREFRGGEEMTSLWKKPCSVDRAMREEMFTCKRLFNT